MDALTPYELLIETLKFDPSRVFIGYDDFVNHIPVLIQLGYVEIANLHYGKDLFYIKIKQLKNYEFRYAHLHQTDYSVGVPIEFKHNHRVISIPYDHRIFQIITF